MQETRERRTYRHTVLVRIWHWINVLCLAVLLMSGLQIFNAHPALYWGDASDFARPIVSIHDDRDDKGRPIGVTSVLGRDFETTGVLGLSTLDGGLSARAFPGWITIPSWQDLATGRAWHFFFAWLFVINGLAFLGYSIASRHLSRDLAPSLRQLQRIGSSVREHLTLSFSPQSGYNVLQRLSYLVVILGFLPLMMVTGLTMSPAMNAAVPWLVDVFGGRQSARTVHFLVGGLIVLFVIVHVAMVFVSGFLNNMRSMITGWYSVEPKGERGNGET